MRTIWKFELGIMDTQSVQMPKGARLLTAQMQGGHLQLWAEVDTTRSKEARTFRVFGTGNEIPAGKDEDRDYIATVQNGPFMWHIYEQLS